MKKTAFIVLAIVILSSLSSAADLSGMWGNYHYYGSFQKESNYTQFHEVEWKCTNCNNYYLNHDYKREYRYHHDYENYENEDEIVYYEPFPDYNVQSKSDKVGYSRMYYWLFGDSIN